MRQLTAGVVLGVLVVCGAAYAQDIGWPPAPVGRTGQVTCWDASYLPVDCEGTGQDGDLLPGVAWPTPRFTGNLDGTVTDNLTGLVWLANASCTAFFAGDTVGQNQRSWFDALSAASGLSQGYCGLSDSSAPGDWRLPSVMELHSLMDYEYYCPTLSNAAGTAKWVPGDAFLLVGCSGYWSSTTLAQSEVFALFVSFENGEVDYIGKPDVKRVWPVRGGPIFGDGFGPGATQQWSGEVP